MRQEFSFGAVLGAKWKPVRVELFEEIGEEKKPVGNFPSMGGSTPLAISAHALNILYPLIKDNVEILDLITSVDKFHALNVFTSSCLDHSRSELERSPDGRVLWVKTYAFQPECLQGKHIFRLPEMWTYVFVDDIFKEVVERNKLGGLLFYKVSEVGETKEHWKE
jgi:hypothetical protein